MVKMSLNKKSINSLVPSAGRFLKKAPQKFLDNVLSSFKTIKVFGKVWKILFQKSFPETKPERLMPC